MTDTSPDWLLIWLYHSILQIHTASLLIATIGAGVSYVVTSDPSVALEAGGAAGTLVGVAGILRLCLILYR